MIFWAIETFQRRKILVTKIEELLKENKTLRELVGCPGISENKSLQRSE